MYKNFALNRTVVMNRLLHNNCHCPQGNAKQCQQSQTGTEVEISLVPGYYLSFSTVIQYESSRKLFSILKVQAAYCLWYGPSECYCKGKEIVLYRDFNKEPVQAPCCISQIVFCQQEARCNFSLGIFKTPTQRRAQLTLLRRVEHYLHTISLSTHCTYVWSMSKDWISWAMEQQGSLSYFLSFLHWAFKLLLWNPYIFIHCISQWNCGT